MLISIDQASWEDEDAPEPVAPKPAAAKPAAKAAGKAAASDSKGAPAKSETAAEARAREQAAVEESDLDNTRALFGTLAIDPKMAENMKNTASQIASRLTPLANKKNYVDLLDHLLRELTVSCKAEEVRKLASTLSTIANTKQKVIREADKGVKKVLTTAASKRPVVTVEDDMDFIDDEGDYDDYDDDFM